MQDSAVTPGEILASKYRVDHLLGEGGMGVVVAATNVALNQKVAIKLLRAGVLDNAEALGRFTREARAAASLRSEHVARVLDVGNLEDGRPYMVMEHLSGRDLGAVIAEEPALAVAQAVDYVLQVCEAIAEAHGSGIIHRDLKPKNLFLTHTVDGRPLVKVLDFGISKLEGPAEELQLTRTTEIIGSPSYMSPEQLRASRYVDARTDIWALGVILYELLTKGVPFHASGLTELVAVVLMEEPLPLRQFRPDVPPSLADAVMKCLQKRPADRFASVAELARAIAPFAGSTTASFADRVQAVASGSGKLPPIAAGSEATLAIDGPGGPSVTATLDQRAFAPRGHEGRAHDEPSRIPLAAPAAKGAPSAHGQTSMQWGQARGTQPPPAPKTHGGTIALAAGLLLVIGVAATGGAVWYAKRASAAVELPAGRKDLPPIAASPSTVPPVAPSAAPSVLPDSRGPLAAASAVATAPKPIAPVKVGPKPATPPTPPRPPANELDDIGRR